jgi:hypothetical protein
VININDMRTAFLADQPDGALDRVIRREMATGRRTLDIYDELSELLPQLATMPECTGDAEEALNGALLALIGQGSASTNYKDREFTTPHSREDVASFDSSPLVSPAR